VAFPYLPGSGQRAFQGAACCWMCWALLAPVPWPPNIIRRPLMLIYTPAFAEGDRVEIPMGWWESFRNEPCW